MIKDCPESEDYTFVYDKISGAVVTDDIHREI